MNLFLKLYLNLFKRPRKIALLAISLIAFLNQSYCSSNIPVQLIGFSEVPSFIYLYEIQDGIVGVKEFVDIISVSEDGEFAISHPINYTRVYEFEAPPWSWKVIVRANGIEKGTLSLIKPSVGARKLRGNIAKSVWGEGHPSHKNDAFRVLASKLDDLVLYDRMLLSGAVGGAMKLVDSVYIDSVNQVFQIACFQLLESDDFKQESYYADLVRARLWQWRRDSGWGEGELMTVWTEEMQFDTARSKVEKARSPGWCSSWIEVHGKWFEGVQDLDSVDVTVSELDFAMWWWDLMVPNSMASIWWAQNSNSELSELRSKKEEENWDAVDLSNQIWTTPSSDLVSFEELYGNWSVILVVKNGSGTCLREWDAFRAIENALKSTRKDLQFVVLCIDGTQKEWDSLVSKRNSVSEILRWVGSDCRWLDGLNIESIPQTIIISPSLEVNSASSLRPSSGLGNLLSRLSR